MFGKKWLHWGLVYTKTKQKPITNRRSFGLCPVQLREENVKDLPQVGIGYDKLLKTAEFLLSQVPMKPKIGIICGFGLNTLTDTILDKITIPYDKVPNFPVGTVEGNIGQFIFGELSGSYVVCMNGRFYPYEGYPLWKCTLPIRVMKLLGIEFLISTTSAGGVNPAYTEGDVMLIKDHIDLMGLAGNHPMTGPNDVNFGPRFFSMNKAYDKDLIEKAKYIWHEENYVGRIFEGVYTCVGGPNYETVAELRMLKLLGADAVGMSTVYEVLTARHCGLTVFAFCVITDKCVLDYLDFAGPVYEDILDIGRMKQDILQKFVHKCLLHITYRLNRGK